MIVGVDQRIAEQVMAEAIEAAWRQHADRGLSGSPSALELAGWAYDALTREAEAHQEVLPL